MRTSKLRATIGWLLVLGVSGSLLIGGGVWLANTFRGVLEPGLAVGCTATVDGNAFDLAVDQTENAALISTIAIQRDMPARAASIALATALQESKLRNINYGDLDSIGLFQQRPSQDWGTVEQIMDPVYSTNAFYDALAQVPNYANLPINDAAQIVQRSAFPHAYAQHEPLSRAFASALTGQSPAALNCTLPPAASGASQDSVIAALHGLPGPVGIVSAVPDASGTLITVTVPEAYGWLLAHWSLAHAQNLGITAVSYDGQHWDRSINNAGHNAGWQAGAIAAPGELTIQLAPVAAG